MLCVIQQQIAYSYLSKEALSTISIFPKEGVSIIRAKQPTPELGVSFRRRTFLKCHLWQRHFPYALPPELVQNVHFIYCLVDHISRGECY